MNPTALRKRLSLALALAACFLASSSVAWSYEVRAGKVRDGAGKVIELRGVNWFGFETANHVVHGLWARNWTEMILQMQAQGFNAVRLPFCPGTLHDPAPPTGINYERNADLQGMSSIQVMDKVIHTLSAYGMYVLLDHHTPDCKTISELWYTPTYSEQQWIGDLIFVAQRYAGVPGVIGIDLKNEPHGAATWGTGNNATDWNRAAERAAAAVLKVAPQWLIAVEGVGENPTCSGNTPHVWGGNLEPLACTPLQIPAHRLLLAPHTYGPDVYAQTYFSAPDFPRNMPAIWEQHFGKFVQAGYAVVLGEFGGKFGRGDARDVQWHNALVDYLIAKNMRSAFYWSWNPNSADTGGILEDDWTTVRTNKIQLLQRLWGTGAERTAPVASPPPVKRSVIPGAPRSQEAP